MVEKDSYSIFDIREADPQLEKHRKDVLEKYLEYGLYYCRISIIKEKHWMM